MSMMAWLNRELNDPELEGTLARYTRPRRGGGSRPVAAPQYALTGDAKAVQAIGAASPQMDGQYLASQQAKDDGTSTPPGVTKSHIQAYMNDPEWKKWDEIETSAMTHSGWGPVFDANTGGAYSRGKQMSAANASYKKREIEKRYLDMALMEAARVDRSRAEGEQFATDIVAGLQAQNNFKRQSDADALNKLVAEANIRQSDAAAEASRALAGQRGQSSPIEVSPGASLFDPSTNKSLYTAPLTPAQRSAGGGGSSAGYLDDLARARYNATQSATAAANGKYGEFAKLSPEGQKAWSETYDQSLAKEWEVYQGIFGANKPGAATPPSSSGAFARGPNGEKVWTGGSAAPAPRSGPVAATPAAQAPPPQAAPPATQSAPVPRATASPDTGKTAEAQLPEVVKTATGRDYGIYAPGQSTGLAESVRSIGRQFLGQPTDRRFVVDDWWAKLVGKR